MAIGHQIILIGHFLFYKYDFCPISMIFNREKFLSQQKCSMGWTPCSMKKLTSLTSCLTSLAVTSISSTHMIWRMGRGCWCSRQWRQTQSWAIHNFQTVTVDSRAIRDKPNRLCRKASTAPDQAFIVEEALLEDLCAIAGEEAHDGGNIIM